jgi:hypothetical protein
LKRKILFVTLITLIVIPLVFAGCLWGSSNSDNKTTTPSGFVPRAEYDAFYNAVFGPNGLTNNPPWLTSADFSNYATLDDIPDQPDLSGYAKKIDLDNFIANLSDAELELLKEKLGLTTSSGDGGVVTGEVAVVLDGESPQVLYSTSSGSTPYRFSATVMNGTAEWRSTSFWVTLNRTTSAVGGAGVKNNPPKLTVSLAGFGVTGCDFPCASVPAGDFPTTNTIQLLFTPCVDFGVILKDGASTTVYFVIDLKTENTELWEITIEHITSIKL